MRVAIKSPVAGQEPRLPQASSPPEHGAVPAVEAVRRQHGARTAGFGALLPTVPAWATLFTVVLYLLDRPDAGNRGLQLAVALGGAVSAWLLLAVLRGAELTSVESASAETYEEMRPRVLALEARIARLDQAAAANEASPGLAAASLHQARALVEDLRQELAIAGGAAGGSPYRWIQGHGYANAWRAVQRAEDLLLAVEPVAVVRAAALTNLDRMTTPVEQPSALSKELGALAPAEGGSAAAADSEKTDALVDLLRQLTAGEPRNGGGDAAAARLGSDAARAVVRESSYRIHKVENDSWVQIVNLRNHLFTTLVLAVCTVYAVVVLAVLSDVQVEPLTGAVAFFLAGGVVGVFAELHAASGRDKGRVFDYGLATVRLLALPVLSGIAAVGGVLVTNLAGSYVLANQSGPVPKLADIFSLGGNTMGLVVALIFGLTPGLLLSRLDERTNDYKSEIEKLAPSTETNRKATP